jgi:FtsP/CotA-like multicopper oxidase with cupredoxin domain
MPRSVAVAEAFFGTMDTGCPQKCQTGTASGARAKSSRHRWLRAAAVAAVLASGADAARAGAVTEPPVFSSVNGVLDLLMIATPITVPTISYTPPDSSSAINPIGWIYEVCQRPPSGNVCPSASTSISNYGGVRLALQKGDALKIRLVNQLPLLDAAKVKHVTDAGQANLYLNPTNIHTHGLIVQPRAPTLGDPSFGDYVFVEIFNSTNGTPVPQTTHQHGSIVMDAVDYRINIPSNHPSGSFWFHPHIHGIALNQVSAGMSGIISIGSAGDYACEDAACATKVPETMVRNLILKDMQVLAAGTLTYTSGTVSVADGEVQYQEDPAFCAQYAASSSEVRQGSCPGHDNTASAGNDYVGGIWYFTVNGQQFPTVPMTSVDGEIWRLTNASGSVSYDLQLVNDQTQAAMTTQLLSVDGVSVALPQGTALGTMVELGGSKFKVVACPSTSASGFQSLPVCVSEFVMMPSSRAELWVTYRDAAGNIVTPPSGATGTFKTIGLTTGAAGDSWPAVDLAKVQFNQSGATNVAGAALNIKGDALASVQSSGIFGAAVPYAAAAALPSGCAALAAGHRRRIFFGLQDTSNANGFGLGYEEVDQTGAVVSGTQVAVSSFDPSNSTICLPLATGQMPVHETWELVNLATENHNFHIHQTKFRLVNASASSSSPLAPTLNSSTGAGILEDNVPMAVATTSDSTVAGSQNGYCTIAQWHSGDCTSAAVVVDIPFAEVGEFVFHCHILEHEDGGMMAKIQVVPSAN